jgi:hypothetical protein
MFRACQQGEGASGRVGGGVGGDDICLKNCLPEDNLEKRTVQQILMGRTCRPLRSKKSSAAVLIDTVIKGSGSNTMPYSEGSLLWLKCVEICF